MPGKWPLKNGSVGGISSSATIPFEASHSTTLSTMRNGSLCGRKFIISDFSNNI